MYIICSKSDVLFFPRYKSSIFFKRIGRIKEIFQSNLGFSKLLTERAPVLQTADSKSGRIGIKKKRVTSLQLSLRVIRLGLEPKTPTLKVLCSTS